MNTQEEIWKHMKVTVGESGDVVKDFAPEDWLSHFDKVGDVKVSDVPHFRVKIGNMIDSNKLHIQFGTDDVTTLHDKIKSELRTPFVLLSGKCIRGYGLAFDLIVKSGTVDCHQLTELGHKVRAAKGVQVMSLAQADDYCMMEFVGIEDGQDNAGEPCKMLVFELAPECRLYIRFSEIEPVVIDGTKNLPELRAEWLLAWLCANYLAQEEE